MKAICKNCRWWVLGDLFQTEQGKAFMEKFPDAIAAGECRIHPPVGGHIKWPTTSESDFCGKFERKEENQQ